MVVQVLGPELFLILPECGKNVARRFLLTSHYIILGWRQVLTSVTPAHDYIKHRTEIKVAVGCLGLPLKSSEEESTINEESPTDGTAQHRGDHRYTFPTRRVVLKIF